MINYNNNPMEKYFDFYEDYNDDYNLSIYGGNVKFSNKNISNFNKDSIYIITRGKIQNENIYLSEGTIFKGNYIKPNFIIHEDKFSYVEITINNIL
jgi:hypothetical protein